MTDGMRKSFNWLHKQAYSIRRHAEANCRKISAGKVPWSPKMQGFWDRLSLWKILLKKPETLSSQLKETSAIDEEDLFHFSLA